MPPNQPPQDTLVRYLAPRTVVTGLPRAIRTVRCWRGELSESPAADDRDSSIGSTHHGTREYRYLCKDVCPIAKSAAHIAGGLRGSLQRFGESV
jgi:hypothetical protein